MLKMCAECGYIVDSIDRMLQQVTLCDHVMPPSGRLLNLSAYELRMLLSFS